MSEDILLIDKPSGMTSHDVVNRIRRATGIRRVGHAGTLDPLATGLLIILVGRQATKQQSRFLKQNKSYLCTAQLGVSTDSYDSQGKVTAQADWTSVAKISQADIEAVAVHFRGVIHQQVPAFSAVKRHGRKLYELARKAKGEVEDLPIREVEIFDLQIKECKKDSTAQHAFFNFEVSCSSGTYVRSLAHDIGIALGVGATVTALRRIKIGGFGIEQAISLTQAESTLRKASEQLE